MKSLRIMLIVMVMLGMSVRSEVYAENTKFGTDSAVLGVSTTGSEAASLQTSKEEIDKIRETVIAKIKTVRDKAASQQAELSKRLNEQIQKRLQQLFEIMTKRQAAAVERLEGILGRIDSRLVKLDQEGKNVVEMKKILIEAQTNLRKAKETLEVIRTEYTNMVVNSENPKEGLMAIKDLVKDFKSNVDKTQVLIKGVVKQMKLIQEKTTPTVGAAE